MTDSSRPHGPQDESEPLELADLVAQMAAQSVRIEQRFQEHAAEIAALKDVIARGRAA